MRKITAKQLKAITEPGRYHAGAPTLYLLVTESGSRSWIQRLTIHGQRTDLGLGSAFDVVSFSDAIEASFLNRRLVHKGIDPRAEKRKKRMPTFRAAAVETYKTLRPRWRSPKVARNWEQQLERYVMPHIGDTPIDKVGREEVLRILVPVWSEKAETGRRLRRYIRSVMKWAMAHGFIEHDPAGEGIDGALPRLPSVKENFRALDYRELPHALEAIEASDSSLAVRLCFRWVALTICRSGEARAAEWSDIDMEKREWKIPASRTKSKREWRQPLSTSALEVLERAKALRDDSGLLFPSQTGKLLSDATLLKALKSVGLHSKTTIHGLRSAWRVWASENTNAPRDVMELCLAHQIGDRTEAAYARSELWAKRDRLIQQYSDFLTRSTPAKVVELRR